MKLQFQLEYRTAWGEDVRVEILLKRRRGADVKQIHQLNTQDGLWWSGEVVIHEKDPVTMSVQHNDYMQKNTDDLTEESPSNNHATKICDVDRRGMFLAHHTILFLPLPHLVL